MNENFIQGKFIEDPHYIESKKRELMEVTLSKLVSVRDYQLFEAVKHAAGAVILTIFLSSELVTHIKNPDQFKELETVWFNLLAVAKLSPSIVAGCLLYITGRISASSYLKYIELDQEIQKFSQPQPTNSDQV